jgi:hypothetical protein
VLSALVTSYLGEIKEYHVHWFADLINQVRVDGVLVDDQLSGLALMKSLSDFSLLEEIEAAVLEQVRPRFVECHPCRRHDVTFEFTVKDRVQLQQEVEAEFIKIVEQQYF